MRLPRRALLAAAALAALPARAATGVVEARPLVFPRDHGAHPEFGIEWWYATGWLQAANARDDAPAFGFQLTFFRWASGVAQDSTSRFAARHLLFAHAALTDLGQRRLRHAERIVRWNGDPSAPRAAAALDDTRVQIGDWSLRREGTYRARMADAAAGLGFDLMLEPTQPVLLQGIGGLSRKGPQPHHASHYYSQPQLEAVGTLGLDQRAPLAVRGRAWLDHEWSSSLMPEGAVGWDWIGINLDDGGALTAFQLRDANGRALWAGGSHRSSAGAPRAFGADEVQFEPLAWWNSAATRARYPVRWRLRCPSGAFEVLSLLDAQELDGRSATGTVYWEGLSELRTEGGARVGRGYLEMTGYAAPLRIGG